MTHSVDNRGGKYDKTGNKVNWWSEHSAEHFKKKSEEMIKEYSKLVYHGRNVRKLHFKLCLIKTCVHLLLMSYKSQELCYY